MLQNNARPGDNGGPPIDDDGPVPRMHFFKADIEALYHGLLTLSMEQRGFYIMALVTMYRNMGGLPIDDRKASLMMGNVDIRFYRRLKQQLISLGLLVERDNCIANKRVEDEISEYVREYKRRRDAALIREAKKRNPAQKALLLPEVREKLGRSSDYFSMKFSSANHDASQQVSEKPNEINGCGATTLAEPTRIVFYARTRAGERAGAV